MTRSESESGRQQRARAAPLRLQTWWWQCPHRGGEAFQKPPGGGLGRIEFLGLMELTQLAGLVPDPQGVASLINRENWGDGWMSRQI